MAQDVFSDTGNPDALQHMQGCKDCRNIYSIDSGLEKSIASALVQQEIPKGLFDQIELTLDHARQPAIRTRQRLAGLVAIACVLLMIAVAFMAVSNKPFRYQNLQQLTETAVASHLKGNTIMSFTADKIEPAVAMLSKELKFNVIVPDLRKQGYALLGGRLCVLGKCKIAYLFYKKQDRTCSLFIMDYDYLDFEMADGSRFSNEIKGCRTDIWKDKGQVYAMVYSP